MAIDGLPGSRQESSHLLHGDPREEGSRKVPPSPLNHPEPGRVEDAITQRPSHVNTPTPSPRSSLGLVSLVLCF